MDVREAVRKAFADIAAGSIFVVFGLAFAIQALDYELGTALRMGPGYFPLLLGAILVALGALIVGSGVVAGREEPIGGVPLRGLVLIPAAFVLFGLTVRGLGVVPALFIATLLAALASSRVRPPLAVAIAAGLTVLSVLVFIVALQLRLPLFGPWLPL